jgi:hypothetical protein
MLYTSATILHRQQIRMAAQESPWGPVSVVIMFGFMLSMICMIAAVVAVLAVPALRSKLTVLVAVVSSEVCFVAWVPAEYCPA